MATALEDYLRYLTSGQVDSGTYEQGDGTVLEAPDGEAFISPDSVANAEQTTYYLGQAPEDVSDDPFAVIQVYADDRDLTHEGTTNFQEVDLDITFYSQTYAKMHGAYEAFRTAFEGRNQLLNSENNRQSFFLSVDNVDEDYDSDENYFSRSIDVSLKAV